MILAGDVGGTHTRLGLFSQNGACVAETKALNRNASSLEELIDAFLRQKQGKVDRACFAIAGHVEQERCRMTNLNWTIEAKLIGKKFSIPKVHLVNDIEAHGHGLHRVSKDELFVLQAGQQQPGNQALVFCGTGLGEAALFWDGVRFAPSAGEGGHVDFAPRNDLEIELLRHLQKKYGHVSYERIVSGPGLSEMVRFFVDVKKVASSGIDPMSQIFSHERENMDEACQQALDLFLSIYGAEAGNVALKFLSVGGLYIGGGVVSHFAEEFKKGKFLDSFCDKGRFKALLQSIPVILVRSDRTALLGAAWIAKKFL